MNNLRITRARSTVLICLLGAWLTGCSTQGRAGTGAADGGEDAGVAADGGELDAQVIAVDGSALAAPCETDRDCVSSWQCDRQVDQQQAVSGAPGGKIDLTQFPGGSCTPHALGPYDPDGGTSCDPLEPLGAQGCGADGVCVAQTAQGQTVVGCRLACEPSATSTGCPRDGYTCDFSVQACVEACRSDAECRLVLLDSNGDGRADALGYDDSSNEYCDAATGRCTHDGGSEPIGAACSSNEDCSGDGVCLDGTLAGQAFPGGQCTRLGCDVAGRECEGDSVCEPLRPLLSASASDPMCFTRCEVGAEPPELQLGPDGHGKGCRPGYRCHYNGGMGASDGVCVGGVYNDVETNNIGQGCQSDSECYSPFGMARCLTYRLTNSLTSPGICTVLDCAAPGLPDNLCGEGNECVGQQGDQTLCMHNCEKADECPAGFACVDDDDIASTPRTCYPVCREDADCHANERCALFTSSSVGQCMLQ